MHHPAFGINSRVPCGRLSWLPVSFLLHIKYTFQIHFVSLVSFVSIHLMHLSTHLCHHRHCYHPSLLQFFTPDS